MNPSEDVIVMNHLKKYYKITTGILKRKTIVVKAVDDVSLTIKKGEIVGLVGESGSGKTTLARLILKLIQPTESTVFVQGFDIFKANGKQLREIRKKVSVVFQDPAASLNPRICIGDSIMRPLIIHGFTKAEAEKRAKEVLVKVNLNADFLTRYPHQLSGGQQQRVSIARALILEPEIIILDEPTSALDISVQAQILNLLLDLQEELHLTYLVISHDLNVIRYLSDKIAVMYLGKLLEYGLTDDIFESPSHPYTKGLITSAPVLDPRKRNREKHLMQGEADSLYELPKGCRLSSRCPQCSDQCKAEEPELLSLGNDHFVACRKIGITEKQ